MKIEKRNCVDGKCYRVTEPIGKVNLKDHSGDWVEVFQGERLIVDETHEVLCEGGEMILYTQNESVYDLYALFDNARRLLAEKLKRFVEHKEFASILEEQND